MLKYFDRRVLKVSCKTWLNTIKRTAVQHKVLQNAVFDIGREDNQYLQYQKSLIHLQIWNEPALPQRWTTAVSKHLLL